MSYSNSAKSLRVIVTDDHPIFRRGLAATLKAISFVHHVAEAANGKETLELLRNEKYDLILLDIEMPVMDGRAAAKLIDEQYPDVKMIAISSVDDSFTISKMYQAGCEGYLIKNSDENEIIRAITSVMDGKKFFSAEVMEKLSLDPNEKRNERLLEKFNLSASEIRIIELVRDGKANKEIAEIIGNSYRTIEVYRNNIYRKIKVNNTAELINFAIREGIIRN